MAGEYRRAEYVGFLLPICGLMAFGLFLPLVFIVYQSLSEGLSLRAYSDLVQNALFLRIAQTTFEIAIVATIASIILSYPIALHLSRTSDQRRPLFMLLVLLPFWTSALVKSYSYIVVLGESGLINQALVAFGIGRVQLIFNRLAVIIGMSNYLIPFVVFPLLANLLGQDEYLRRSAEVMGASNFRIFWQVTFPLSLPGLLAGATMSFVISLGFFITPALLGGRKDMMIGNLIDFYTREALDWHSASAIAILLLLTIGALLMIAGRFRDPRSLV